MDWLGAIMTCDMINDWWEYKRKICIDADVYFNSELSKHIVKEGNLDINLVEYHLWRNSDASKAATIGWEVVTAKIIDMEWNWIWIMEKNPIGTDWKSFVIDYKPMSENPLLWQKYGNSKVLNMRNANQQKVKI